MDNTTTLAGSSVIISAIGARIAYDGAKMSRAVAATKFPAAFSELTLYEGLKRDALPYIHKAHFSDHEGVQHKLPWFDPTDSIMDAQNDLVRSKTIKVNCVYAPEYLPNSRSLNFNQLHVSPESPLLATLQTAKSLATTSLNTINELLKNNQAYQFLKKGAKLFAFGAGLAAIGVLGALIAKISANPDKNSTF